MNNRKYILLTIVILVCLGYASYQKLEFLAVMSLLLICALAAKQTARRGLDIALSLVRSARLAKYKDVEIALGESNAEVLAQLSGAPTWVQVLALRLQPAHLGLIFSMRTSGSPKLNNALKERMRELRECGLVAHNEETMERSTEVFLTDFGREFVDAIRPKETPEE